MSELQTKHKQIYGNDAKLISDDGWCARSGSTKTTTARR